MLSKYERVERKREPSLLQMFYFQALRVGEKEIRKLAALSTLCTSKGCALQSNHKAKPGTAVHAVPLTFIYGVLSP